MSELAETRFNGLFHFFLIITPLLLLLLLLRLLLLLFLLRLLLLLLLLLLLPVRLMSPAAFGLFIKRARRLFCLWRRRRLWLFFFLSHGCFYFFSFPACALRCVLACAGVLHHVPFTLGGIQLFALL